MTPEEIKLRRIVNHHLITPVPVEQAVQDLCGVQAQFLGNAMHALRIRCLDFDETSIADKLMKNWTLRGTAHLFSPMDFPLLIASGPHYRSSDWTIPSFWNQRKDWSLNPERQRLFSETILAALSREPCSREKLKEICRAKGMTVEEENSMFHPWGGGVRELCERGFVHYSAQEEKIFCLTPVMEPISKEAAELELARRYFTVYGPSTIHDAMYFFRVSSGKVKAWLSKLPVLSCEYQGMTYFYIENETRYDGTVPPCLFLAGFDQLMLGYEKKESLFLPRAYMRNIFNLAGIVLPPLLLKGNVAGRWHMKNGKLTIEPFRSFFPAEVSSVQNTAETIWPDIRNISMKG